MTTPVSNAEHVQLYDRLRASLLSRHFALGRFGRTDLLSLQNQPFSPSLITDFDALDAGSRRRVRWNTMMHQRENPLLWGGRLFTCLAVERALGAVPSAKLLDAGMRSLRKHFKFGGEFAGYPVRWDSATSDDFTIDSMDGRA
jgi:hypothetical protein